MRTVTYRATERDEGKRVEKVLMGPMQISRGLLSRLKRRERGICVNGERVYSTCVLQAGDVVTAEVGDEEPPKL
ncbi:MAG: RluA family pseudouridine synthase, partial [Clostridia bacterium]|nr:RluA family pseudouridine synthase [Clostridia bacterium]